MTNENNIFFIWVRLEISVKVCNRVYFPKSGILLPESFTFCSRLSSWPLGPINSSSLQTSARLARPTNQPWVQQSIHRFQRPWRTPLSQSCTLTRKRDFYRSVTVSFFFFVNDIRRTLMCTIITGFWNSCAFLLPVSNREKCGISKSCQNRAYPSPSHSNIFASSWFFLFWDYRLFSLTMTKSWYFI